MKRVLKIWLVVLLLATAREARAQGFINLNFESAKIIPDPTSPFFPFGIAVTNALPGWTVILGGSTVSSMTYNAPAVGATFVTLDATNGQQLSGKNSVVLQGGLSLSSATISQTALVPVGTDSLFFEAQQSGVGNFVVSLGGQNLAFSALGSGANYTLYGADVSAFAGQVETLSFSALQVSNFINDWNLDNIQFSSSAVPEPGALGLFGLGSAVLVWQRRKLI